MSMDCETRESKHSSEQVIITMIKNNVTLKSFFISNFFFIYFISFCFLSALESGH